MHFLTELQVQLPEYTVDTSTKVTVTNQRTLQTEIFHDVVVSPANSWVTIGVDNIMDYRYRAYSSGITAPSRNFIASFRYSF